MREIKFRGKRIDNGEWVYGYFIKTEISEIFKGGRLYKVDPETVGQYTGRRYKNSKYVGGKEIYSGDIMYVAGQGNSEVVYLDDACCFALRSEDEQTVTFATDFENDIIDKVIGNKRA